jgi:ketosteroid isomerase-like protein
MSNIESAKNLYNLFVQGNIPEFLNNVDSSIVWEDFCDEGREDANLFGTYSGIPNLGGYFQRLGSTKEFSEFSPDSFIAGSDNKNVTVKGHDRGNYRADGLAFAATWIHLLTFNEQGKLERFTVVRAKTPAVTVV